MERRLIIDGNAVYELDEDCMLRKRLDNQDKMEKQEHREKEDKKRGAE